jgi:hypothetical protein
MLASLGAGATRPACELVRWTFLSTLDGALSGLDAALRTALAKEAVEKILDSTLVEDILDRLVGRAVDSPEAEQLVGRVIDSRLVDEAVARLLESDGLWLLVERIAQSPAVTDAIGHQGIGFADQMAGVVRDRSRTADDRLERFIRRLARRAPRNVAVPETG